MKAQIVEFLTSWVTLAVVIALGGLVWLPRMNLRQSYRRHKGVYVLVAMLLLLVSFFAVPIIHFMYLVEIGALHPDKPKGNY